MKKQKIQFLLIFLVITLLLCFTKYASRYFMKSETLCYNKNIAKLDIMEKNKNFSDNKVFYTKDKKQISQFIEKLNKLELIQEKVECNTIDNNCIFISILNSDINNTEPFDGQCSIDIIDNYLFYHPYGLDYEYESFYIKNNINRENFYNYLFFLLDSEE